ncbi:Solute carrier organic anion transporter family member 1C1 [Armadillidium nasatum]|uniref:Solute carrier organic anion transporter family member 1C1 n=1 Tax=Armadillidium nasatum TaxID=96803 RepID=A0A5N5T4C9_9CRUS|nr:Solute carrier organic anion transporter family member 1C1 [Armadillidium nasatum]
MKNNIKKKINEDRERKKQAIKLLEEMDVPDIKCGLGSWTPRWLQVFATKEMYLIGYCIVGLVIGMFFTYSVSTISTLEKRFKLSSIMLAGNDVSQILLSILVAYYGNYGNRPKWLGIGVLSASFSCFLAAVPHFIYGPGEDAVMLAQSLSTTSSNSSTGDQSTIITNKNDLCYAPFIGDCSEGGSDFNSGNIGPVIILFLSEFFVGVAVTVFYSIGLIYLDDNVNKKDSPLYYVRVCGPVLGFFLGSKCLSIYIDPKYKPNISLRDPRWLGAWWIGVASLVASVFGFGVSGIVIKIFRPGPRFITGYSCFLTIFGSIAMFGLMFIGCPKLEVVGPNYNDIGTCNENCDCSDRYSPVCSEDGLTTFYSACYAGCTIVNSSAAPVEYLNCACVKSTENAPLLNSMEHAADIYQVSNTTSMGGKTIQGYCPETCDTFFYYILLTTIARAIDSTGRIGGTLVYLRSIEEHDKGLAMGVSTVLISLFSFIPAPIIMGAVVDSSCIIWDNTCGQKGNCWLYDSDKFRILIHVVPAVLMLISLLGDIFVFINSRRP